MAHFLTNDVTELRDQIAIHGENILALHREAIQAGDGLGLSYCLQAIIVHTGQAVGCRLDLAP